METARIAREAPEPLVRARAGGVLRGFARFLGREEEAEDWRWFVEALPCAVETKKVMLQRGALVLLRSREQGRLVLV